ncbi:hypothetical protein EVAR_7220_1 [Eumeta japonica]|uniref:Uncharacterized protein n=1 Tax=Eumeta variegata TaxID=151549 RepID=A0A4C1T4W8_EUMVA|nr:hypothetical protein EVAR_7220_1 [Eumeta japonica]
MIQKERPPLAVTRAPRRKRACGAGGRGRKRKAGRADNGPHYSPGPSTVRRQRDESTRKWNIYIDLSVGHMRGGFLTPGDSPAPRACTHLQIYETAHMGGLFPTSRIYRVRKFEPNCVRFEAKYLPDLENDKRPGKRPARRATSGKVRSRRCHSVLEMS